MIAVLEALLKWEDKLLGHCIHIMLDYKALEFFNKQQKLLSRQLCWHGYPNHFQFKIMHIKGVLNLVADILF